MAIARQMKSDADHAELLDRLIAEQGIGRHGLFLVSGEGRIAPDGFEETSGFVVGEDGRVFFFWTGCNDAAQATHLRVWQLAEPRADWIDDAEYRAARQAAGLP